MEKRVDFQLKGEMLKGIVRGDSDYQSFGEEIKLNEEELKVVESAKATGIGVLPNLLGEQELHTVRSAFDKAYGITSMDITKPGKKSKVEGIFLFRFPAIAQLLVHPRILSIVSVIMDGSPCLFEYGSSLYTPPHPGMKPHDDGFEGKLSSPFHIVNVNTFLDDISVESGARTYVPGTHLFRYSESEGTKPREISNEELDRLIEVGDYVPIEVGAGSAVFQIAETWHAVNPIHHLRRYVTGIYINISIEALKN